MTLGESIEKALSAADLPEGTLINSPRVLLDYSGTHGYHAHSKDIKNKETKRLNARVVSTRNKKPDLI